MVNLYTLVNFNSQLMIMCFKYSSKVQIYRLFVLLTLILLSCEQVDSEYVVNPKIINLTNQPEVTQDHSQIPQSVFENLKFEIPSSNPTYIPSEENLKAREWFQDNKFGLFVHWGVYSVLGDGEWVMNNRNISIGEYTKLPSAFNPIDFDPKEWVQMVKDGGMKYITITSRHHDGFSMFDSEATDYDIVDNTPYGKDVLKMLAEECHKQGIKLFFYYSLLDWKRDDYYPRGRTGNGIKGRSQGKWEDYIVFMKAQLRELLTNYGPIGGIWFDGHWDQVDHNSEVRVDWHYDEIYSMIHELQPHALIGNNHHRAPFEGEDFQMFERDLPGVNTTGWGTSSEDLGDLPFEVCETINGSWGFNRRDRNHKSKQELIHLLVKSAGYGSNLLLNVGPMPNGKIQSNHVESIKEMGAWLQKYGITIYETRRGPTVPNDEYVTTQKDNLIYVHILNKNTKILNIEKFHHNVGSVEYFDTKEPLVHKSNKFGLSVDVSHLKLNSIDNIVVIQLK